MNNKMLTDDDSEEPETITEVTIPSYHGGALPVDDDTISAQYPWCQQSYSLKEKMIAIIEKSNCPAWVAHILWKDLLQERVLFEAVHNIDDVAGIEDTSAEQQDEFDSGWEMGLDKYRDQYNLTLDPGIPSDHAVESRLMLQFENQEDAESFFGAAWAGHQEKMEQMGYE